MPIESEGGMIRTGERHEHHVEIQDNDPSFPKIRFIPEAEQGVPILQEREEGVGQTTPEAGQSPGQVKGGEPLVKLEGKSDADTRREKRRAAARKAAAANKKPKGTAAKTGEAKAQADPEDATNKLTAATDEARAEHDAEGNLRAREHRDHDTGRTDRDHR